MSSTQTSTQNFDDDFITFDYLQVGTLKRAQNRRMAIKVSNFSDYVRVDWRQAKEKYPDWNKMEGDDIEFVLNQDRQGYFASSVRPVLSHQETGICTTWDLEKSYGFIEWHPKYLYDEESHDDQLEEIPEEIFVHVSDCWDSDFLQKGDEVLFTLSSTRKGMKAKNVRFVSENPDYRGVSRPNSKASSVASSQTTSAKTSRSNSIVSTTSYAPSVAASEISVLSTASAWSRNSGPAIEEDETTQTSISFNFDYYPDTQGVLHSFKRTGTKDAPVWFGKIKCESFDQHVLFQDKNYGFEKNDRVIFTLVVRSGDDGGQIEARAKNIRPDSLQVQYDGLRKDLKNCSQKIENLRFQKRDAKGGRRKKLENNLSDETQKRVRLRKKFRNIAYELQVDQGGG